MSGQKYSVTIDVGADISNARAAMRDLLKIFNTLNLGAGLSSKLTGMFSDLSKALDELEKKSGKTFTSIGEVSGIEKAKNRVSSLIGDIAREFSKIQGLGDTDLGKNFIGLADKLDGASKAFKTYDDAIAKNKKRLTELLRELDRTLKEYLKLKDAYKEYETFKNKLPLDKIKGLLLSGIKKYLENELRVAEEQAARTRQELEKYAADKGYKDSYSDKYKVNKEFSDDLGLKDLAKNAKDAKDLLDSVNKSLDNFNKATKNLAPPKDTEALGKLIKLIKEEMASLTNGTLNQDAFNLLKTTLGQIFGKDLFKDIQNSDNAIDKFKERIDSISTEKITALKTEFPLITLLLEALGISAEKAGDKIEAGGEELSRFALVGKEIDAVSSRLKYFFSLAGGFNLMRRAIRLAVTTTKELDAVMTLTAVVSQYTVGDMWKTLPQYSKEAKKLGTEIKDVYSAQTLYVQLGLDMNSAMDLGIETLKMARVANIDASEATNSMTAALRGFNMELNQTSALRVNDVYSKLAQNTASDVKEISTAMTKTAALANSANMSFENTAAFLATIIESTREGAETAGTALKTVIARFTEVKKLYTEDLLTGTDEEGQEIDVNKISTALKTAGINMNEFFTGAKGLDEIFKELGSKWNSLTTVLQRYIATLAAGSRQQSRFLALMQNYNRTVELTDMAYNSAGSGQEQFEKTLDSLEAKINKFKDEWNTFIMGIANSDLIKGSIDFGTKILEIFNSIINALSGGNGLIKSITSLGLAIGTFKLGRGIFGKNSLLSKLIDKTSSTKTGANFGKNFLLGFGNAFKTASDGLKGQAIKSYLGGYFYLNFGIRKADYGEFTKEQYEAALSYLKKMEEYNNSSVYNNMPGGEKARQSAKDIYKLKVYYALQEKNGLDKEQADKALEANKTVITDYNALGNAAMLAGTAIYGVTTALEANGKVGEKTAGVIKGVAASFIAMGGAMKIISALGNVFPTLGTLAAPIGIAVGAVTLIAGVYDALTESEAEKTERYKKQVEESSEYLNSLKNSYKDLEDSVESLSSKEDAFDGLIKGTKEWDEAVKDLNTSVSILVEKYPELVKALEYNENGVLTLNKDIAKGILEDYKNKIADATYMNVASKNLVNELNSKNREFNVTTGGFNRLNIIDIESEEVKKVKKAILSGIEKGLLTELASFTEVDIDAVNSEGYKKITSLLSDYLTKLGITNFSLDNALLKGAVALEKYRLVEELKNNLLLADSLEQRLKIIEDIFTAEAGTIKLLALEGTEKAYKKAYDSFESTGNHLDEIPYLKRFAEARGGTWGEDNPWYYKDAEGKSLKIKSDVFKSFMQTALAFDAVEEASKVTQEWFSTLTKEVKDFVNGVGKRSDLINPEIKKAFDDLDDGLFDYSDIKNKWLQEYNLIDRSIAKALNSNIFDLIDKIDKQIEELKKLPASTSGVGDSIKLLKKKREELLSTFTLSTLDLGISAYDKIGQLITTVSNNQGTAAASKLASSITSVLGGIGNYETRNTVASKLYEVNWSTIKNIDDLKEALNELGATALESVDGFEELAKLLIETLKVLKTLSLKDLLKEAKERLDLRDSLKSATSATFDEDTYKKLVKAGAAKSDFIYTGQGYTYTKGELKDLGKALEDNLSTVIKDTKDDLLNLIEAGEIFEKAIENFFPLGDEFEELYKKFLSGELQKEDSDTIRTFLNSLGIKELYNELTSKWMKLEDLNAEALTNLYQKTLEYLGGLQERKGLVADIDTNSPFWGKSADYARQNGANALQQIAAAISDAERAGFNVNELTNYALLLSQVNTTLLDTTGNANELAYTIAYDNMLMNLGISELSSNYSNWEKILKKAAEDEKIKSTVDYTNTIVGLREALLKITGTTVDFSEEFLTAKENLDLFKKAAKGDSDAINLLRKNAAKGILLLDGKGLLADLLNSWINDVDLDNIKIGAELDTNVADVFLGLLDAGIMTADLVNLALESIGYEPNVEYLTMSLGAAKAAHLTAYITSPLGGMTKVESDMLLSDDTLVQVPIIGGSKAGKAAGIKAPTYKGGAGSTANPPPKSGGGGGGKEFKNDFDKYYNQVEDINELIRQRNLLESDYNQLLKTEGTSGADIYKNLQKQLKLLEERRKLTADLADKRKQLLFETMAADEYKDVAKYAKWNEEDQTIEIDWEAINKIKDSKEGDLVKEYIKKLEELLGKYDDQVQALEEIQDLVQEIKDRGKEEYLSLESRVRDALIKLIQDKIDELTEVDRAINDTNLKLFDSISQTLELLRQERTNKKTEEELSDKEKRLAYLQQDSSGANAVEIAQLQEELADARQDYTDNLIDLKISELQRLNDEAQELRLQLIELMQLSLNWQEKSGAFWDEVYRLISEGTDATGALLHGSELETLLKTGENWEGLSAVGQMQWLAKLQGDVASALAYLEMNRLLEDIGTKEGTQITFTNGKGEKLTGTVDKEGNVVVKNADGTTTTYKDVFLDYHGNYRTFEEGGETLEPEKPPEKPPEKETYEYKKYSSTKHWKIKFVEGKEKEKTKEKHTFKDNVCTKCGYKKKKKSGKTDESTTTTGTLTPDKYETDPLRPEEHPDDRTEPEKPLAPDAMEFTEEELAGVWKVTGVSGWQSNNSYHWRIKYYINVLSKKTKEERFQEGSHTYNNGICTVCGREKSEPVKGPMGPGGGSGGPGRPGDMSTRNFAAFSPDKILSSRDSNAFMYLTDVYSNASKSNLVGTVNGGDNYYDIKVQVDSLGSDYDVDKAIDRIKARIAQENAYRNVNILSRLR